MDVAEPGRGGSSSSRGRRGRGRGKAEPQWLPKPETPTINPSVASSGRTNVGPAFTAVADVSFMPDTFGRGRGRGMTTANGYNNAPRGRGLGRGRGGVGRPPSGDANWNGASSAAAGSSGETANSSRNSVVNAVTASKVHNLITPGNWQHQASSSSSSGMPRRSVAPTSLATHRPDSAAAAAAAVAAAAAIPLPQRSDHADRDLLQDLASKTQSRAVTARFCPVRVFQQQISQLSSQSSQPQTPPAAAAAAAGATASGIAGTRPASQAYHSNSFSGAGSSSSGANGTFSNHQHWNSHPAAAAAQPPPPPMFGAGRGDISSRGRGRGIQRAAAAAAPHSSYLPGVYTAAAAADREFAAASRGRGRGRGRAAAAATAAGTSSIMYPAAAAAAVPMSSGLQSQMINAGRLSAEAAPYTPHFSTAAAPTAAAAAAVPSTFRTHHHLQPMPSNATAAAAEEAKQQRQQLSSAALISRPMNGLGSSSSSNPTPTTVNGSSNGAASAGIPAAAAAAAAAPAGTGAFIPFASDLISSSSSSSRGRGRGRGRAREPPAAAADTVSSSSSSSGRGRGRGGRFTATASGWQPMDAAAAAGLPGSSQITAAAAAGRGLGRGRGRMSGYTFAGSRLVNDSPSTAPAASPAAVGGSSSSSSSSNAAHLLPLDEDALFGHIRSDAAAESVGISKVQQQQDQQDQQSQQQQQQRSKQQQVQQQEDQQQSTQQQQQQQQRSQQPPDLHQTGDPAQQVAAATAAAAAGSIEKLTCVVCLDHPIALAVTPCDHHQLCARCCLRLRICYKDKRCPLCKTECKKVMIIPTPATGQSVPTFESLTSQESDIWQKPKWCPGVLTNIKESVQVLGHKKKVPLYVHLLQMTAIACRVCDPNGQQGLHNMQALSDHLLLAHGGLTLCPTCVAAHRKFPLELDTFTPQALQRHQESAHKHCEFCSSWFYAVDELWSHMNERHFLCNICQAAGTPHLYFKDSGGLRQHYATAHHPCNEGECADSLVAFGTEQELRQHQAERHSSKMPRFKKTNACHIMLDFPSTIPRYSGRRISQQQEGASTSAAAAAAAAGSSRGAARGMQQSSSSSQIPVAAAAAAQEEPSGGAGGTATAAAAAAGSGSGSGVRRIASAGNVTAGSRAAAAASNSSSSRNAGQSVSAAKEPPADTTAAAAAADPYAAATRLGEGGLQMIDDDIGMTVEQQQQQQQRGDGSSTGSQQQQPGLTLPGLSENGIVFAANPSDRQQQQQQPAEEFPDLAAAAGSGPPAAAAAAASGGGPALVKATARCSCGRRQMHLAIKEGQPVPKLPCDRECDLQQRRHQIADAFGVESPEHHVAHWDRHRTPNYSPTLLQAYKQDPEFIEQLEKQFMDFLSSSSSKSTRMILDPMTKAQREIVHEYAEQGWGFVSHSTGAEPNRWVQIFKTPSAGAPTQLLSQAAILISQSAIDNMLKASAQNALTLRLVDITPGANLAYHLREWAGEYKTSNEDCHSGSVSLTFANPKIFKSCSDQLAGGIRGVFRVERGSNKTAAAAAAGADGHHGGGASGLSSSSSSSHKPSGQRPPPAAAVVARSSAAAPAAAGWQTISKGRAAAAPPSGPPPVDPWADDDQASIAAAAAKSAAAAATVPDDWEEQLNNEVDVPKGPALNLQQHNMWDALGED